MLEANISGPSDHRSTDEPPAPYRTMRPRRNNALFDRWSITHYIWGVLLGWIMLPFWALTILILWEPLEIFAISPLVRKTIGKQFGYETVRNSLSDILFDAAGVATGAFLLRQLVAPPFVLFA